MKKQKKLGIHSRPIKWQKKSKGMDVRISNQEVAATPLSQKIDWGLKTLQVPEIWKESRGRAVKIAILDTGIIQHPDLKPNIKGGANFTTSNINDYTDRQGHGTHVAGIIAAADNEFGVVGVAPEAEIYAVKVLGDDGSGAIEWIVKGIDWAIEQKMDIISMSLGSSMGHPALHDAVKRAYAKNVTIIAAAGNDGDEYPDDDIDYPGRYPETICVGAINKYLKRSWFSSDGEELDIMAPGEDILSTYLDNDYKILSGTSMATPFISGVVALIIAKHRQVKDSKTPVDTPKRIYEHLIRTATDAGEIGKDNFYGYGIVSPSKLMQGIDPKTLYDLV